MFAGFDWQLIVNSFVNCFEKLKGEMLLFNWQQMVSAFIVLFAVIDIIGSIPIIINLKEKGKDVNATKATVISFALLIGFFYAGDMMLKLFHVDIESFAVAGAFVIFLMSLEMILDIEIFKIRDLSKKLL